MTAADKSHLTAFQDEFTQRGEHVSGVFGEVTHVLDGKKIRMLVKGSVVLGDIACQLPKEAETGSRGCGFVCSHHHSCQLVGKRVGKGRRACKDVQFALPFEAVHHDNPFNGFTRTIKCKPTVCFPGDGKGFPVNPRRVSAC